MTKRFLMILVLGLLWCNVGFAEVIKWTCTHPSIKYVNFKMDTDQNKLYADVENNQGAKFNEWYNILSMDNEKIVVETPLKNYPTWEFYYGTDQRAIDQGQTVNYNCKKTNSDISFTINDKKEQCEAIGFTPQTDKFADCVLRLVELDIKSQQTNQIALAESQGNQLVADELRKQRNQQGGQYLMDLGQKLLNPSTTRKTTRCTVNTMGGVKTVSCR